jgi:ribosomal-protein-alanine N-acetyltransferase
VLSTDFLKISYRYLTKEDLPFILEIEESSNPHPWSKRNFLDCLERGHYSLLQLVDEKPTGFAIQSVSLNEAHLLNIGIHPDYRRRGLGEDLLEQILYSSKTMGCSRILLEARVSNEVAISLYRHKGFKKLAIRKGYYKLDKEREDAIIMFKNLKYTWKNYFSED